MPNDYSEKKYNGPEAIIVAMDIGTTQSAVSFAYFSPGSQPQLKMVDRWPGQAHWNGAAKTPSIVSYRDGLVKACGAEAMPDFEKHQESVAYRFKLHLHPASLSSNSFGFQGPPLPAGITIERVYADLMRYLMEETKRFFETTTPNGVEIWARLRDTIVIVLATPNGWDIREQATLRKASIRASLVAEENAEQLLQFVTEAEASVHYALTNYPDEWLRKKTIFAVVDCGGSIVDTTVYRCVSPSPLSLEEACPRECMQAGGIFVNREFRRMLENKLKGSAFSDPDIINSMTDAFEKELKPKFDGMQDQYELKFGVIKDNDPSLRIDRGRITLSTQDLAAVFDVVTDKICNSCSEVLPSQKVEYVILVGGFGDSPYVQKMLSARLSSHGMQIITVQDYGRKAAALGAIIGHIKRSVVARAARATFGGCVPQPYERSLHRERKHTIQVDADGKKRVNGAFHVWVKKGAVLMGTFAHKLPDHVAWDAISTSKGELIRRLGAIETKVFAWEGGNIPIWCKDEHGAVLKGMRHICTLNADLSCLAGGLQIKTGSRGRKFYRVDYEVCVYFGGAQLRATLQWKERGVLREGPVKVMPVAEQPDERMRLERLDPPSIPDDDNPSEAATAKDDPLDSRTLSSLSELPQGDVSNSPDVTKLMIDHVPCDLSGQVTIPDRENPARGGLADVHVGWFDERKVAVKVLRIHKNRWPKPEREASDKHRITREMHIWAALKHRNICDFLGYSMDSSDYPAMISTWYHHGNAYNYLESQILSVKERIQLALDASEGLCFLHGLNIVHGDLKPSNVLVDDICVARLCDFGLVQLVDWERPLGMTTTSPYNGTERYKAPELFASRDNRRPVATFEGDMYSLGCVMVEFIEQLYPFKRFARVDLQDAIMDGKPPSLRAETMVALLDMTDLFWDLLETCWSDPSRRPNIKEVIDALQGFAHVMPPTL